MLKKRYFKKFGSTKCIKQCVPCCQTKLVQQCDATGCYNNFQPYAIIDSMGPTKPGTRRERCCCLRKEIKKMKMLLKSKSNQRKNKANQILTTGEYRLKKGVVIIKSSNVDVKYNQGNYTFTSRKGEEVVKFCPIDVIGNKIKYIGDSNGSVYKVITEKGYKI